MVTENHKDPTDAALRNFLFCDLGSWPEEAGGGSQVLSLTLGTFGWRQAQGGEPSLCLGSEVWESNPLTWGTLLSYAQKV